MKTRLTKTDITVTTDEDIMRVLLDGYVVKSKDTDNRLKLVDGKFIWLDNTLFTNTFILGHAEQLSYEVYKEEQIPWYENIPEQGILCWVGYNKSFLTKAMHIVTYYVPEKYNVRTLEPYAYDWATPVTLEEIKQYILEEANHD